jgi:8-oxo-dGTP pyrophosphatase MutT (NUDIX family)
VSPFRPDLVDVWIFRVAGGRSAAGASASARSAAGVAATDVAAGDSAPALEILLMRRSPGRILPGLWQCVSGSLEAGESITDGALRELREETGFGAPDIQGFYDLDQVNQFHEPSFRAIVTSAIFAVRVGPDADPALSHEHDAMRWVSPAEALDLAVWPAYRESIRRIAENLADPERAIWFELTLGGERARR